MFSPEMLILAFAGGVFGAAIGGLNAFVFTGLVTIVTVIFQIAGVGGEANPAFWAGNVNWGIVFAPIVSFQGGATAAAYAKKAGKLGAGNDIVTPLWELNDAATLAVGGITGVIGWVVFQLLAPLFTINGKGWTDAIALGIILIAAVTRYLFGNTGFTGKVPEGKFRWAPGKKPLVYILQAVMFLPFCWWAVETGGAAHPLGFGLTAFWLIYLVIGKGFPVSHQVVHPAMIAAVYSGSIWWGLAFAVLGAFLNDIFANLYNNYGDTHIDPPAGVIAVLTTLAAVLVPLMTGSGDLGGIIAAVVLAALFFLLFSAWQKKAA